MLGGPPVVGLQFKGTRMKLRISKASLHVRSVSCRRGGTVGANASGTRTRPVFYSKQFVAEEMKDNNCEDCHNTFGNVLHSKH